MKILCKYEDLIDVKNLKPHPKNRNKHPKEQIHRLAKIIEYQGVRAPVVISKLSGFMVKGHGTSEALDYLNWQAPVVYQDFESEEQEYAFMQSDNAIASWAELDLSGINSDIGDLGPDFDIDLLGIKDFVLEPADKIPGCDEDEVPEPKESICKLGDLWILGEHRLLCGDSTNIQHVERLMNGEKADMVFTDPPYGMNLDTDWSGIAGSKKALNKPIGTLHAKSAKKHSAVIGDDQEFDPGIIFGIFDYVKEIFLWGADYYCQSLPKEGSWIVWDKTGGHDSLMNAGFASNFELCWSKQKHKRDLVRITWKGAMGRGGEIGGGTVHPTQKPIAMAEWFLERWGKSEDKVIDLFGGSGSTLIACEKTNRKCFMMELDPHYCDVIVARWEKYTGQKAKLDG